MNDLNAMAFVRLRTYRKRGRIYLKDNSRATKIKAGLSIN